MSTSLFVSLCASASLLPAVAFAQPEPEPEPEPEAGGEGDKVELEEGATPAAEETPYEFGETGEENPGDPNSEFNKKKKEPAKAKAKESVNAGYPIRAIDRPVTLPGGTSEAQFALPALADPYAFGATLRGTYAITSEAQVGLRYGMGALTEDGFDVGKAVSLDTYYGFTDNISAQLSIPVYLDPGAFGVVLGAPMRFAFFDSFALEFGQDLISIKAKKFLPSIDNASQNAAALAFLDTGTIVPKWRAKTSVRGVYQWKENMTLDAEFGAQFDDTDAAAATLLNLGVMKVQSQNLDLGAKVLIGDLAHLVDTLGFNLFVGYRI